MTPAKRDFYRQIVVPEYRDALPKTVSDQKLSELLRGIKRSKPERAKEMK